MLTMDEKLERFIRLALTEAAAKRDGIIEETESYKAKELSKAEDKCLEKAYKAVQHGASEARKEHDRIIAMEPIESKKKLLAHREKLTDTLFDELLAKIKDFKESPEYAEFLYGKIEEAVAEVGEGKKIVFLDKSDEKFLFKIKEKFSCDALLTDGIIGGAIVENVDAKKISNNSLSDKIDDLRSGFLSETKFSIY